MKACISMSYGTKKPAMNSYPESIQRNSELVISAQRERIEQLKDQSRTAERLLDQAQDQVAIRETIIERLETKIRAAQAKTTQSELVIKSISLALGGTDEWTDYETMCSAVVALVNERQCQFETALMVIAEEWGGGRESALEFVREVARVEIELKGCGKC